MHLDLVRFHGYLVVTFWWVELFFIIYLATLYSIYFFLMVAGFFSLRRIHRLPPHDLNKLLHSPMVPSVSVIAPAHNEELNICESVRSMLRLRHPRHEVIVVNDGSKDSTLARLTDEFHLYRSSRVPTGKLRTKKVRAVYESRDPIRLLVIDKENGGKADALNTGINYSRMELFAAVDADSLIERDALMGVIQPFLEDSTTLASGGIVRVANGCRVEHGQVVEVRTPDKWIARMQVVEYLRAYLGGRMAFSKFNSLLVISGAFGLFRREQVARCGGFAVNTVGEDMELVLNLHADAIKSGFHSPIVFVPEPVCWTEVPESFKILRRQRNRWQRGALESIRMHLDMMFARHSGVLGWFGMPYFTLFEVFGPVVELGGYLFTLLGLVTGFLNMIIATQFFIVSVLFGMVLSLAAVLLEEMTIRKYPAPGDMIKLLSAAIIESFGYRQISSVWRTQALFDAWRGKKSWGSMERRGLVRP